MAKTLLVIGKKGQLGQSIKKIGADHPELVIHYVGRDEIELEDNTSIKRYFEQHRYDCIVNAAAYTAVDKAEAEPELAEQINNYAVAELAKIAKQQKSKLIHISTDYVFDGKKNRPYKPTDPTNPQSVYGKSKLHGEQAMQAVGPVGAIVRTSWLYSEFGNNFVKTMLRLGKERDEIKVVLDQVGSPTYATDLAGALLTLAQKELTEIKKLPIYHYANLEIASWYDLALAIFEFSKIDSKVIPITTDQYFTAAKRPQFSVIDSTSFSTEVGVDVFHWKTGLRDCLASGISV
jgi:dTDP-4-dehydrorhamnose reductase